MIDYFVINPQVHQKNAIDDCTRSPIYIANIAKLDLKNHNDKCIIQSIQNEGIKLLYQNILGN